MQSIQIVLLSFLVLLASVTSEIPSECKGRKPKVRKTSCCDVPKLITKDSLEDCKSQYSDSSDSEDGDRHRKNHCVLECYFNQTGIFNNGKPVKAVALDVLGRSADAELTEVLNTAIDTCITELEKHEVNKPAILLLMDELDTAKCSPKTKFFIKCIETNIFLNCPQSKKSYSEKCTKMIEYLQKCKPKMPPI